MVKKTTPGRRAVLLNKETKSKKLNDKKVEAFMKEFLKTTDKQKIISPPTNFEKALIIQEPTLIRIKTPKKIILPPFVQTTAPKKTTTRKKK
jgi:hypothetical protein